MENNSLPSADSERPGMEELPVDKSEQRLEPQSEGHLLAEWTPEIKHAVESDQAAKLPDLESTSTENIRKNPAQAGDPSQSKDSDLGVPLGEGPIEQPEIQQPEADLEPALPETRLSPAEHARQQALAIFDFTRPLHELSKNSRRVLETASLLHDTPLPPTKKKPLRAARELVRSHFAGEFSPEESKVLAAVLAYHRGKIRRKHFDQLDLTPVQQREALTIAALLRIATGLNASNSGSTSVTQVDVGRDELWIVVDGPQSDIDAAAAQHNASLWVKIGYPEVKVMREEEAAAIRIPFPEPSEIIGIQPDDAMSEAGRKVMLFNFARMLSCEEETRKGQDIEALHDMRVATRRMRASFEVFGEAFERRALKSHLVGLRQTGRLLGAVRDLDVFMEKAQTYLDTLPPDQRNDLDILLHAWHEQRETAREKMLTFLISPEYHTFKREFNIFVHTPGAGRRSLPKDQPAPDLVREVAPMMIYTRLAAVRAYGPWLENAPIERLHALRIEFKKLRYTVEYFREVLGLQAGEVIDELKTIQDHLGDMTDAQVATEIVEKFVEETATHQAELPIEEHVDLQPVVAYLDYRRDERNHLMATFKDAWRRFSRKDFRKKIAQAVSVL
jgi:CHAD domain-containing protein